MRKIFFLICFLSVNLLHAQQAYVTEKNIAYYSAAEMEKDSYLKSQCTIDLYYPKDKKNFGTIVWFHGGSITGGSKEIPAALMNKGYAVIGVGYRLSPKVKAPTYIEDAAAAISWAFKHIADYGGSDKLIFISGHSAGAYLGMMVTLDQKYLAKHQINANKIAGLIAFSGQAITHFTIRKENGINEKQAVVDQYAPLFHVRADAPPMLLLTGDREMELLGRYEENAYLLRMMKLTGNTSTRLYELEGYGHDMAYPAFPLLMNEVETLSKKILAQK